MSKFKSINYSRVVCEDCNAETIIEPGREFSGLNCTCNIEKALPLNDSLTYTTDGENRIEAIGMFKNGDVEVKYIDGALSYRVPGETFKNDYSILAKDINDKTETKEATPYQTMNIKSLRKVAKEREIKGYSNMNKETLLEALKAE